MRYFFDVVFFGGAGFAFAIAALVAAQRFFKAVTMAALPAALSFRVGFDSSGAAGTDRSDPPLILAHLALCPSAIRRRAAAATLRFHGTASVVAAELGGPPDSMLRSLADLLVDVPLLLLEAENGGGEYLWIEFCWHVRCSFLILSVLLTALVPYYTLPSR